MMPYAGIGSRSTPPDVCALLSQVAYYLARRGYTLRSGGARGADSAFEEGARSACGPREIFLPNTHYDRAVWAAAEEIAKQHHPAWERLNASGRRLMTRNTFQVLGADLQSPSEFVICWTPGGEEVGGTAQALRLARVIGVRITNLGNDEAMQRTIKWVDACMVEEKRSV